MADQRFIKVLADVSVISSVDMVSATPGSPSVGDTHISTTTGGAYTANNLYTYTSLGTWVETVATQNLRVYHEANLDYTTFTGNEWVTDVTMSGTSEDSRVSFVAGSSPTMIISDADEINFGKYGFTIIMSLIPGDVSGTKYLCHKEAGGIGYGLYMVDDDLYLRYDDGTHDDTAKIATAIFQEDQQTKIAVVINPTGAEAICYYKIGNGTMLAAIDDVITMTAVLTTSNASDLYIGSSVTPNNFFEGDMQYLRIFNFALNAIIINYAIDNNAIYVASQGNAVESLNEGDFATHADWDVTGDFTCSTGSAVLTWSADKSSTLTQTNANLANPVGLSGQQQVYLMRYDATLTQESGNLTLTLPDTFFGYNFSRNNYGRILSWPYTTGTHVLAMLVPALNNTSDFVLTATSSGGGAGDILSLDNMSIIRGGVVVDLDAQSLSE